MAVAFVSHAENTTPVEDVASTGTTARVHTTGNFLVVSVIVVTTQRLVITDLAGNRFYQVGARATENGRSPLPDFRECSVFFAFNIKGHAANVVTVTPYDIHGHVPEGTLGTYASIMVDEFSGMGKLMPDTHFATSAPSVDGTTAWTTPALSPTSTGEALYYGTSQLNPSGAGVSAGFTVTPNVSNGWLISFHQITGTAPLAATVSSAVHVYSVFYVCFGPRRDGYGLVRYTDNVVQGAPRTLVSTAPMDHDYGHLLVVALTGIWNDWDITISDLAGHTWFHAVTSGLESGIPRTRIWFVNPCKRFTGNVFTANFSTATLPAGQGTAISLSMWEFSGRRWQLTTFQAEYWAQYARGTSTTPQLILNSVEAAMSMVVGVASCDSQQPYPVESARYQMDQPRGDASAAYASLCRVVPEGGGPGGGPITVGCLQGASQPWMLTAIALTTLLSPETLAALPVLNQRRRRL